MLHPWAEAVQSLFTAADNPRVAGPMAAYMKHHFPFHGITSQHRTELLLPLLQKDTLPLQGDVPTICQQLWQLPQREYAYAAMALMAKFVKRFTPEDYPWILNLITQRSWWDSVDHLAGNVLSTVVNRHPESLWPHFEPLILSDDFWLNRTAIIVQLRSRENTDTDFLTAAILPHMENKEFFLRKAIGWSLRQYARHNPQWVIDFVHRHESSLSGLSKREALKRL